MKKGLSNVSLWELKAELNRRKRRVSALTKRRAKLLLNVNAIDREIAALSGSSKVRVSPAARNVRRKGGLSVREAILHFARNAGAEYRLGAIVEALQVRYKGRATTRSLSVMASQAMKGLKADGFFSQEKKRGPYTRTDMKASKAPAKRSRRSRRALASAAA